MAKIERYCWSIFGLRQPSQATQQAHPKSLSRFYPASHTLSVRGRDQSADHTKHKVYKLNKPGQGRPLGRVYLWLKVFGVWYTNHGLNFLITKGLKNQLGEGVMVSLESQHIQQHWEVSCETCPGSKSTGVLSFDPRLFSLLRISLEKNNERQIHESSDAVTQTNRWVPTHLEITRKITSKQSKSLTHGK